MSICVFFFQAEDGIRDLTVTGVQTCALPICVDGLVDPQQVRSGHDQADQGQKPTPEDDGRADQAVQRQQPGRSEEHTSELQSQSNLVCRLLLEKKKKKNKDHYRVALHKLYSY